MAASTNTSNNSAKHPWRRYCARTIDNLLISLISLPTFFVVGFVISIALTLLGIHAETTEPAVARLFLHALYCAIACLWMIAMETVLLAHWGTTPGKRLLGISVTTAEGYLLAWPQALHRSVWVNATLFGLVWIPVAGLIFNTLFMLRQRRRLLHSGYSSWDQPNRILVTRIA